jgi:hypothetical protein
VLALSEGFITRTRNTRSPQAEGGCGFFVWVWRNRLPAMHHDGKALPVPVVPVPAPARVVDADLAE